MTRTARVGALVERENTRSDVTARRWARCRPGRWVTRSDAVLRDDEGSSLILALIFLTVVSLIAISLATWVGTDLVNAVNFRTARSTQNAADGAAEMAIQYNRYIFNGATLAPNATGSNPAPCLTSTAATVTGSVSQLPTVSVFCSTTAPKAGVRQVVFVVCSGTPTGTACAANPLLSVTVLYFDYPYSASSTPLQLTCTPTSTADCGLGMEVTNWSFE